MSEPFPESRQTPPSAWSVVPAAANTPNTDPRAIRHPAIVKELARACWFDAQGNCYEAARLVAQKCSQDMTGDYPSDARSFPSPVAIRRWAKTEGWTTAFAAGVAQDYPNLVVHLHARLASLGDQAIDTLDDLTRPGYVPSKEEKIRLDAAKHVTVLLGLGTAGVRGGQPTVTVQAEVVEDGDDLTPSQRSERARERLQARKAELRRRKQRKG